MAWSTSLLLFLALAMPLGAATELHVSPTGRDSNTGTRDRPLATLGRAVAAARATGPAGTRILLQPGTYVLREPIVLSPADSGLTIEGMPRSNVTLSGGRRVTGWKPWRGRILQADLSRLRLPDLDFRELYYNTRLMLWARVPNFDARHPRTGGFLQNERVAEAETKTKFVYPEGSLHPERWAHPERAWIMFHDSLNYETQYCPVKAIDTDQRIIEAERGVYVLSKGNPFYICGLLEELDAPGEWCVDPETRTLYFWPPSGDPNGSDQVIVPALPSAFVVKGDTTAGKLVENVRLAWLALRDFRGRTIEMIGARGCTVAACDLRNAEVGVYLGDDTHACRVVGCDITQTQGDGVSIIGTSMDHERVSDHMVDNCYIWDIGWGRIHNRCGGVYMHRCARVKLTHNHVHDTPRYALGMDVGNDCEFAYNYCHHSNLVTADTSIIEAATAMDWGLPIEEQLERNKVQNAGNSVHHNLLHDSGGWGTNAAGELESPYYSWGIYLDLACSNWRIHDNVVYNTVLGGFMSNAGVNIAVENNVFVDGQKVQVYFNPWDKYPTAGNRCERNIIAYQGQGAALYNLSRFEDSFVHFERNLVWANGQTPAINGLSGVKRKDSWAAWLAQGRDKGTVVADPQFVDPGERDYRLRPTSPALALGFQPIDLTGVGNYASPERRTWPRPEVPVVRDAMSYAPLPAGATQPRLRTYEDVPVGSPETGAHAGNNGAGTALVTDETAAGGRHSLKFTDAAGLAASFFPYVTYPLELEQGALRMSFDLRWEPGALMALDWRDDPWDYNMGPNLTTDAEGMLSANGREVVRLPAGQWVHFDLVCGLGPDNTGTYDLTVTLPGEQPRRVEGIAHSPGFTTLNCIVFMSLAETLSIFYLDNLAFEPRAGR